MKFVVTRQNPDGTYDEVGMTNRTVISGYKTIRNAMKYGVIPFGRGRKCRVEQYIGESIYGTPYDAWEVQT